MFYLTIELDHAGGGVSSEVYASLPIAARLNSATLVPNVASAANGTNYVTYKLIDNGATDIFSADTQSTGLTAGTPVTVTLDAAADLDFAAGDVIRLRCADSASGVAANLTCVLEFAPARSV